MNSIQIESWALRVIDCVKKGQPNEDFLVELKRDWIEKEKAARRIAGHANAARGENILWLIGVDENQGVIGVNATDLASWYSTVESCFNELAPRMTPLNIPVDGKTVVALLFETDRAPFVVKNPVYGSKDAGAVELEVPWRENTLIRSARRSDLIRLLAPLERLPEIEIIDCDLTATIEERDSR
ncbi:AlbA family DNA-binding domain-containing protein [Coleofasciculus sp. G2-EDA-02]|uniref:AlbA family DNA-binding domain-containing protein n=1 Tax=Coleofasciculus sp. G2-EDA-02 TaxID=3069529 RepID=UPI0032FA869B